MHVNDTLRNYQKVQFFWVWYLFKDCMIRYLNEKWYNKCLLPKRTHACTMSACKIYHIWTDVCRNKNFIIIVISDRIHSRDDYITSTSIYRSRNYDICVICGKCSSRLTYTSCRLSRELQCLWFCRNRASYQCCRCKGWSEPPLSNVHIWYEDYFRTT